MALSLFGATPSHRKTAESAPEPLERNTVTIKDFVRKSPRCIVVTVLINGSEVVALLDSGSRSDFISSNLVDQLKLPTTKLTKPLTVQLAVMGSTSSVNFETTVELSYQDITEQRRFDVLNVNGYDIILGTPFLFQHKVMLTMNPSQIAIGSSASTPLVGSDITVIQSTAADLAEPTLQALRDELKAYAQPICKNALDTPLPPFRDINHQIPLIDEKKAYSWRPSKCPDALKHLWREKREAYRTTGRWEFRSGTNAMPMLMLKKPPRDAQDKSVRLRTVIDLSRA